jgi:hypothetical protein
MSRSYTSAVQVRGAGRSRSQSEAWIVMALVMATTSLSIFDLYRLLTLLAG